MTILLFLAALAADPAAPAGPPAMVTMVKGSVTLVEGKTRSPAPAPPFLLSASQSLDLAAGAHVVLLRQGGAFTVDGPRQVDPESFHSAANTSDKVGSLLEKRTSLASAGVARGGTVALTRPIPGAPVLALGDIRWSCDHCGPQTVVLADLHADARLWSGSGEGAVRYDGAALNPGVYGLKIGDAEFSVRVAPRTEADAILAGAHLDTLPTPTDRAAATAGALLLGGFPTDAIAALEGGGLTDLVPDYEKIAGLRP